MLSGVLREGGGEEREEETLEEFGRRAEEGDGSVGGGEVGWLPWFWDRNYHGAFPDGRELGISNGEVEEGC